MDELVRLLALLRDRVDPLVARRFACACVRRIWPKVECQPYVSVGLVEQCRRAVELTERSLNEHIAEGDLQVIDFESICDAGNEAFMAAAHVGWNLFAPVNCLHQVNEFDHAKEIAFLAACAGGAEELTRQVGFLQELVAEESGTQSKHSGPIPDTPSESN